MTLIYDDKVKEILMEQLGKTADGFVFIAFALIILPVCQLLIQREIDLIGGDGYRIILGKIDFMNRFRQRCKILLNRLINKNVSVSKVKYLFLMPLFNRR